VLYEARTKGFKIYVVVAILSSFSFGVMHFFYEPATLLNQAAILPKFAGHFAFGLILSGIFWFLPNLRLLIFLHSLSNLWSILASASELGV
jgi:membrane protease YdiL (CAAX protease family)